MERTIAAVRSQCDRPDGVFGAALWSTLTAIGTRQSVSEIRASLHTLSGRFCCGTTAGAATWLPRIEEMPLESACSLNEGS
jgi:hypothetical protein